MNQIVLEFLTGLSQHNDRDWFTANKKQYEKAKAEVENFVSQLLPVIGAFDEKVQYLKAKDCMFRIFRDVRFAKDKSPYKTNMGAWITAKGRKSPGPGYYVHIQPGESFLAAGIYMPEPEQLKLIRKEIYYNIDEFLTLLNDKNLKKYFGNIDDWDKAKTAPRDFPKDFPHMDILKNRHFTVSCPLTDEQVISEDFTAMVGSAFKAAYPYNQFLKRGMEL
jgi:uncharacterized protein (TIGR02453 family)